MYHRRTHLCQRLIEGNQRNIIRPANPVGVEVEDHALPSEDKFLQGVSLEFDRVELPLEVDDRNHRVCLPAIPPRREELNKHFVVLHWVVSLWPHKGW